MDFHDYIFRNVTYFIKQAFGHGKFLRDIEIVLKHSLKILSYINQSLKIFQKLRYICFKTKNYIIHVDK